MVRDCIATSFEVQAAVEYDFRWALSLGDATLQGKHVAPYHNCIYHFYHCDRRQVVTWDSLVTAANSVFDDAVVLLDLWDVPVSRCDVKLGMQVCKISTHWLKMVVCKYGGDFETSGDARTYQCLAVLE